MVSYVAFAMHSSINKWLYLILIVILFNSEIVIAKKNKQWNDVVPVQPSQAKQMGSLYVFFKEINGNCTSRDQRTNAR